MKLEWLGLIILGVIAVIWIILPLIRYQYRRLALSLALLITMGLPYAYYQWGGLTLWQAHQQALTNQTKAQAILQKAHGVEGVIRLMHQKVLKDPDNAKGWYLLGRLYGTTGNWSKANAAFERAYQLTPKDEQVVVNVLFSRWQLGHQVFSKQLREDWQAMLVKNPNQPDALLMLTMAAFKAKQCQTALSYGQRLLKILPSDSEAANDIRRQMGACV